MTIDKLWQGPLYTLELRPRGVVCQSSYERVEELNQSSVRLRRKIVHGALLAVCHDHWIPILVQA